MSGELRRKPKRPKALSALREIRKLQEGVEPILPWLPYVRLVHELLFDRGCYRVQHQAIQALWVAAEGYIIEVLGGRNLASMHRDWCTLAPKDIRLFRRLRGVVDSIGEAPESEEARREDWRRPLDPRRGYGDGHQQVPHTKDADPEEEAEVPTELEVLTPHCVDYDRLHVFNCSVLMNYLVCAS